MPLTRMIHVFIYLAALALIVAMAVFAYNFSASYRAEKIVSEACTNASLAGLAAKESGDENYGEAYWSLLIDELEKASKLDRNYIEVLESAIVTWADLSGNDTMSGDFVMANYVKVNATCKILTE